MLTLAMMRGVGGLIELIALLVTVGAIAVAVLVILLLARSAVRGSKSRHDKTQGRRHDSDPSSP